MQRIFSVIGQAFGKRVLIFGLMTLLSLSSLLIFANQPALADQSLNRPSQAEETIDRTTTLRQEVGLQKKDRQSAYDAATGAINDPQGIEKIYEEDLEVYQKENPGENSVIEGAKNLVDKVTGND